MNITVDISVVTTREEMLCLEEEETDQRHVEGVGAVGEQRQRKARVIGDAGDVVLSAKDDYRWRARKHNGSK